MRTALQKVFVASFYRINAGFFLVVIGLCGGIMGGPEHMALAEFFVSGPSLLLIPVALWMLYGYKVIVFNRLTLNRTENAFVFQMGLLNKYARCAPLMVTALQQLIPATLYAIFLILVAARHQRWESILEIFITLILLTGWITVDHYRHVSNPNQGKGATLLNIDYHRLFTKPFFLFYGFWITQRQPLLILGTKLFNILLVQVACLLYSGETYDERLLAMIWSLVVAGNLGIIFHYHRFENFDLGLLRALPLSLVRRSWFFIISMVPLMIPEMAVLLIRYPSSLGVVHVGEIILFTFCAAFYAYASLFSRDEALENFIRRFLIISMLWIVLILFKVPVWLLAIGHLMWASTLMKRNFYRFEYNSETVKS